ncbi:MAG: peptidoglycan-binding protein [Clostridia bacterium]|nr:peptidoglycan-binding protein [Clostridia bacterium]
MPQRINEREYILNLQRYLRQLSVTEPSLKAPPLDGIFDTATQDALRNYQRLRGLTPTGRADLETWTRLYEDYLSSLKQQARSEGFYLFPDGPNNFAVYPDDENFLVMVVQYILNELRVAYDDIPQNSLSGVYDAQTRQGVLTFQRHLGLPQNDRVDRATWNALVREHDRLLNEIEQ